MMMTGASLRAMAISRQWTMTVPGQRDDASSAIEASRFTILVPVVLTHSVLDLPVGDRV